LKVEDTTEGIAIKSDANTKSDTDAKAKAKTDTLYAMIKKNTRAVGQSRAAVQ
jgi:hypothetical protein